MKRLKYNFYVHKIRCFFKKSIVFLVIALFVGTGFIFWGYFNYVEYNSTPKSSYDSNYQGLRIAHNSTVIPKDFRIYLTINPLILEFYYMGLAPTNGTYSFAFAFPFKVTEAIFLEINSNDIGHSTLSFNTTSTGTVVFTTLNCSGNVALQGKFYIEDTFISENRGYYTIILPFSFPIDENEIFTSIRNGMKLMPYTSNTPINLVVDLPKLYSFSSSVPTINGLDPTHNQSLTRYSWTLNQWQTVTISCNDPSEVSRFETMLFWSGITIGTGVPLIVTTLYEHYKKWVDK